MEKFNIYQFVTPSDPITFLADDDKVAFACALLLGNGKACCYRNDENGNEVNIPSMLMFVKNPEEVITEELGMDFDKFWDQNKSKIKACFNSFAYGSVQDRKTYDAAIEAITDFEKLKEFKAKHEDDNRSSMSKWVQGAWDMAEKIKV